jgi:hypothetical protein
MSVKRVKGTVLVVVSGAVILAAGLLIVLQWGNPAEFSLYGKNYSIRVQEDGKTATEGVNTGLLMLCSAAGGVLLLWMTKVLLRGIGALRKAGKEAETREATAALKAARARQATESRQSDETGG